MAFCFTILWIQTLLPQQIFINHTQPVLQGAAFICSVVMERSLWAVGINRCSADLCADFASFNQNSVVAGQMCGVNITIG